MKYRILRTGTYNKKARIKVILRWLCYVLVLIVLYTLMRCGAFRTWQPMLIIPFIVAVSMHEREVSSSVFAVFAGMLLDLASGMLLGFNSIWLMPCSLMTALLSVNLIKVNFVNHLWMSAVVCFIVEFMNYLFGYMIWDEPNHEIVLYSYFIPTGIATVLLAPMMYFLVKLIAHKLAPKEVKELQDAVENTDDDELKGKVVRE